MKEKTYIKNWRLAWIPNVRVTAEKIALKTPSEVENSGCKTIQASVPGNFELDFMREGLLDDIYFGENSVKAQKNENLHLYYFTEFFYEKREGFDSILCFEGIDTAAEIYLDGELLAFVENMFHSHRFSFKDVEEGKHTLLVHILPAAIYARQFDLPAMCFGLKYNHDAIQLRKSMSMFGWDIMPRIVSGGLWKPVAIEYLPNSRIVDPFTYVNKFQNERNITVETSFKIETEAEYLFDFSVEMTARCKDSVFTKKYVPYTANVRIQQDVQDPYLWWPKNYGEPNLYEVELVLYYKGTEVDRVQYRTGLRHVWLKRTSRSGADGDFCFIVNGKRVFVLGTNWVPPDAFPSRHDEYTLRGIRLADDIGCNMIRCWGGNAYPGDVLYDYCDEHGIMVWQDFALACGHYPNDKRICDLVRQEVKEVAIRFRNHPSLTLWAGDNECDTFVSHNWEEPHDESMPSSYLNPNFNVLTRDVILHELRNHDATRPYLPSSPYIDEIVYKYGMPAEDHLWGPRDYFKGDFYGTAEANFASEIGYHGCPSPKSLAKFISAEQMPKDSIYEICDKPDWLVHAAGMETCVEENPYAYRLPLMISQVERLFGTASADLDEYARQSQISQAEAVKFFIEYFRTAKGRRTGLLWWNIIDGWPQISDAVVDWYGCKKIAYGYIKRSQAPLCLMCAEPKNGVLPLIVSNDTQEEKQVRYTVENLTTGKQIAEGQFTVEANGLAQVEQLPEEKDGFYLICWTDGKTEGINHFVCNIGEGWTWKSYEDCIKKAGFYNEFEGF
ncbi:MAG: hypothetical protein IJV83_02595 [Clostridia bacterium]|nr:hypothetical protein [Clostridia bacterium]